MGGMLHCSGPPSELGHSLSQLAGVFATDSSQLSPSLRTALQHLRELPHKLVCLHLRLHLVINVGKRCQHPCLASRHCSKATTVSVFPMRSEKAIVITSLICPILRSSFSHCGSLESKP